ncbi:MAG: right-handed parallel beta-helix repeat-containing protein [Planctomycetes bacterium]|nr:right-handed parallel beta-helix repeat-containing protein [Planctomycetota bacterium]
MRLRSLVACALLASTALAQPTTHYWVDAVNGSDTNPGTRSQPFQTLTNALNQQYIDVVVHVLPGVYGPATTGDFWDPFNALGQPIVMRDVTRVKLLGEDRASCVIDFTDPSGAPLGNIFYGMLQLRGLLTDDVEIANLTFRNLEISAQWGCGPIQTFQDTQNIDIHNCTFEDTGSTFICWGGFDVSFHDNLIYSTPANAGRFVPIRIRTQYFANTNGDRTSVYNNTIYNAAQGISYDNQPTLQWICNNIVLNASGTAFPGGGPPANVVVENNIAYGNATNFAYTVSSTNLEVDPLLVNPAGGDFHLQSGSPAIEAGYVTVLAHMANDGYGNCRIVDGDDDGIALVDIGMHEFEDVTLAVSNWGQGLTASFQLSQLSTDVYLGGLIYFGYGRASLWIPPMGLFAIDPLALFTNQAVSVPGAIPIPVPAGPFLDGYEVYAQGFAAKVLGSGAFAIKATGRLNLFL